MVEQPDSAPEMPRSTPANAGSSASGREPAMDAAAGPPANAPPAAPEAAPQPNPGSPADGGRASRVAAETGVPPDAPAPSPSDTTRAPAHDAPEEAAGDPPVLPSAPAPAAAAGLPDSTPALQVLDVSHSFSAPDARHVRLNVLQEINLAVQAQQQGEFVVLLGPSGCGKSTLLSMIGGLLKPEAGEIRVYGRPVAGPSPEAVTVFQAYTCFPWLTARQNVEFGLKVRGVKSAERAKTAAELLHRVGLGEKLDAYPRELSGGQQQRVAIARSLAVRPRVLLMDEPFGALDAQSRVEMQQLLLALWAEFRSLVVFVTHDISEALILADRVIVFSAGPARVIGDFSITEARPRSPDLLRGAAFTKLSDQIVQMLKNAPTAGTLRLTI